MRHRTAPHGEAAKRRNREHLLHNRAALRAPFAACLWHEQRIRIADHVFIMNKGLIVYQYSPAELAADKVTKLRYLGV